MKHTNIQWCDSTINPIMGCGGCELYPSAGDILLRLDGALTNFGAWPPGSSKIIFKDLIESTYAAIKVPLTGHSKALTTTNIWHLRDGFSAEVGNQLGRQASKSALQVIENAVACYAARLHLNKGRSIVNSTRGFNKGYALAFEMPTQFPGRMMEAAGWSDLNGQIRANKPWLDGLPRHIFISDMGDAFSRESDFGFLQEEVIAAILSTKGQKHIWQWLTKRPERMARFGEHIGGFPANVIAMTTLTGPEKLDRVDELRRVPAARRGLSIEPLRERIPPTELNLSGIHWVIVGGESGRKDCVHPFDLAWARELRDHCQDLGVDFFLKQLGRRPIEGDEELHLHDGYGGDWTEWPEDLLERFSKIISEKRTGKRLFWDHP